MNFPARAYSPSVSPFHCQLLVSEAQPSPHHQSALVHAHRDGVHTFVDTRGSFPRRLYCFGGGNRTSIFNDLWVLENPSSSSRSWRELPTGPPHRVWFGFAEGAGKLFVVNGMTDSSKFEIL